MKISAQDEYGLRILLRIARADADSGLSIPQLSELEGMSEPYVGKLTRNLRLAGLVTSTRGHKGGYVLAKPMEQITINEVLTALGGKLFDNQFCGSHSGTVKLCTNSVDCSVRSLWTMVQHTLDNLLEKVTLADLMSTESESNDRLKELLLNAHN
ncbi:MAG: Rrf2 family transcriptional regulator [Bacteroidota bacterium]